MKLFDHCYFEWKVLLMTKPPSFLIKPIMVVFFAVGVHLQVEDYNNDNEMMMLMMMMR